MVPRRFLPSRSILSPPCIDPGGDESTIDPEMRRAGRYVAGVLQPTSSESPAVPRQQRRSVRLLRPGGYLVGVVTLTALQLLRRTGARSWNTLHAEDGFVFFQDAYDRRGPTVLFEGYAGYLQLPPRVFGEIADVVGVAGLARTSAVLAAVTGALLAAFVYWSSQRCVASRGVRLALAGYLFLMPPAVFEVTASTTNTIWLFIAVTPWVLLGPSDSSGAVVVRSVVAALAASASVLALAFLPFRGGRGDAASLSEGLDRLRRVRGHRGAAGARVAAYR